MLESIVQRHENGIQVVDEYGIELSVDKIKDEQCWITESRQSFNLVKISKQKQLSKAGFGLYQPGLQTHNINLSMQQIQNKPQLSVQYSWNEFFHGELYSVNDFDDFQQPFYEIKGKEYPTSDGPEEIPKVKVRTYSKKKLTLKYEISFERQFMKEHKAAFRKHYQNHIESIKKKLCPEIIQSILLCFFKSQTNKINQSALDILKNPLTDLTISEKNQFSKDLQHEQRLHEFLDFVMGQCSPTMAGGFISMAQMVWMAYVPMQNWELKLSKLVQFGRKVAAKEIKESLDKHFRDYLAQMKEINEEFLKLLEVFCTTALLTITGYFENPYFTDEGAQLNGLKRPWSCDISSDEEDSFDSWQSFAPHKMRKFQD